MEFPLSGVGVGVGVVGSVPGCWWVGCLWASAVMSLQHTVIDPSPKWWQQINYFEWVKIELNEKLIPTLERAPLL